MNTVYVIHRPLWGNPKLSVIFEMHFCICFLNFLIFIRTNIIFLFILDRIFLISILLLAIQFFCVQAPMTFLLCSLINLLGTSFLPLSPCWKYFGKATICLQKMCALRSEISWTVVTVFLWAMNKMMSESCIIFKTNDHVAIDTSICLFQNFTEPVSKWICLQSCRIHPRVSQD